MQQFYRNVLFNACFTLALSFSFSLASTQTYTVDSLMKNGRRDNRINLAFLPDGFTVNEQFAFKNNVQNINAALFNTIPFFYYKNYFNSFSIAVPSNESGAKHPGTANDEGSISQPVENPDIYFGSSFDCAAIHRLLVPQNRTSVYSVLASNLPDYDQVIMVVNSPYYGGSGGAFATSSVNGASTEIAIHEIGHSLAGLADEYWVGTNYAAEKPNMTSNSNAGTIKWGPWLGINNTGIFPHGGSGDAANWFKPSTACKMQALNNPFCSVCSQAFIDKFHQLVNMIDDFSPATTSVACTTTDSIPISIAVVQTTTNSINVNWYLNDILFAQNVTDIKLAYDQLSSGLNTVKVEAIDNTVLSKSYLPGAGYVNSVTWNISKSFTLPLELTKFVGRMQENTGILQWQMSAIEGVAHFELLKSNDGLKFSHLSNIPVKQNTLAYSYNDVVAKEPNNFYKLNVIKKTGGNFYGPIIHLQNAVSDYTYKVYQDAEQHQYLLTSKLSGYQPVSLQVMDAAGKTIIKKDFGKVNEQLSYNFDLVNFPAGIYFLRLSINHSIYSSKLIAN